MSTIKQNSTLPKIVVILGPTASGKTTLGVKLAKEFKGEIISADSRQVYRGMDVGTGKDLKEYTRQIPNLKSQISNKFQIPNSKFQNKENETESVKVPYHLIDVADPREIFDLAQYKKMAEEAISDIISRGKLPIIVGGSGLYLEALVDNYQLSTIKPDANLRLDLEAKSLEELQNILETKNKTFFDKLNNSDRNNKRRLIRYIEVATVAETHPALRAPLSRGESARGAGKFNALIIGLDWPKVVLAERIERRLKERLDKEDMVEEVKGLHDAGVSWERLEAFGLEYKFISQYLQEKIDYETMFTKLNTAINQFAKRQMTWFKRWERGGKKIIWENEYGDVSKIVNEFLKRNF